MKLKSLSVNLSIVFLLLLINNCTPTNPRVFDIILYSNENYKETKVDDILVVNSRLEIKGKFFEIGVIKATNKTQLTEVKKLAAKKGAEIIIDEGNLNYTLARFKFSKKEKNDERNSIKT